LTSSAKEALRKTVRGLREALLAELHDAMEREYRLSVDASSAGLPEPQRERRRRFESWIEEQVRTLPAKQRKTAKQRAAAADRFRREAETEAAYTLLHRVVLLRHIEAFGLSRPPVVTGGQKSAGYREFRDFAPALCHDEEDDTEGFAALFDMLCGELALDLAGLFGDVGVARLIPIPGTTLRAVVEAFDDPAMEGAWTDDTTLGWVYQFWNDPAREALDAKLNDGGKVAPHEIASKTQLFTERYMVEWLLQNSLGQMWLCMCEKNGWTADAGSVLDELDQRRADWRTKREAGEVALDALMPIAPGLEGHWKYWVPQPLVPDAIDKAPDSIRDLTVLDPACGSGHFLVIAFDLLAALYREEAQHRDEKWSDWEIAESIVEKNLHGVDIDPRCVQIAAAALWLKAKTFATDARPKWCNLVATAFALRDLSDDEISELAQAGHISDASVGSLLNVLADLDHLGSLLRINEALDEHLELRDEHRATFLSALAKLLSAHAAADHGIVDGDERGSGGRFLHLLQDMEGEYVVVVGNPPYLGTNRIDDGDYVRKRSPRGKADLYAAFLERGLELTGLGGTSALLTMRNWMFIKQYSELREWLLENFDLRALGDIAVGGFDDVPNDILSVAISVFRKAAPSDAVSIAIQPSPPSENAYDRQRTSRKRAAVSCQVGRHEFETKGLSAIAGRPIVYPWSRSYLARYLALPKVGEVAETKKGLITSDDVRFLRVPHEVSAQKVSLHQYQVASGSQPSPGSWVPYVKGAEGRAWFEPLLHVLRWCNRGLEVRACNEGASGGRILNEDWYFKEGIAFSMIGAEFSARLHRFVGIFGNKGSSVFPAELARVVCSLNTSEARAVMRALNPGIGFELSDVARVPIFPVAEAKFVVDVVREAFDVAEAGREASVEFRRPGPSPWRSAQEWAQRAVDRPDGEAVPQYNPEYDDEPATDHLSFAVGVALGRFGANGEGILAEAPGSALPDGILFLSAATGQDSLATAAAAVIAEAWASHGPAIDATKSLADYLRTDFFPRVHKGMYENRPIYFPLSSAKKSFVAYVSIHRWTTSTLDQLRAEHLIPEQRRLEGEVEDLRMERGATDKKVAREARRRLDQVTGWLEELTAFIDQVTEIAERGAPPTDPKCPLREVDARFEMDLDDGVMINSAALWPLLHPQWKDPKKWWKELCLSKGRKDYDWAHLARRYFPTRVDEKCEQDPSLAVAHGCFWRLHPAKAYQWELRLQDEIAPDFTIDEAGSDEARAEFLADHAEEADAILAKEIQRRKRNAKKADNVVDMAKATLDDERKSTKPKSKRRKQSKEADGTQ
jgi:hypothetical protein